jgi:endonuclease-3
MNKQKRTEIFKRLKQINPNPTTELEYASAFELLIAVILSAQATDVSVNKATPKLFAVANTPKAIYQLGEEKLKSYIKTIGLYHSKARHVIKTCDILINQHDSIVPDDRVALEALPGVGRKTANVLLNTLFNQPTIAVDTHVFRVGNRTRLGVGKTPVAVEKALLKRIPARFMQHAHHWLVLHGRYICTARNPQCGQCLISDLCEYPNKLNVSKD